MVNIYSAFSIVNKSVLELSERINKLTPAEDVRVKNDYVRLGEEDTFVTERGKRLASNVAAAYDLTSYRKNFYLIEMGEKTTSMFENMFAPLEELDLTEFNKEEDNSEDSGNKL